MTLHVTETINALAILVEAFGVFLLFREVRLAQKYEELMEELQWAERTAALEEAKDYREMVVRDRVKEGMSRKDAEAQADAMQPAKLWATAVGGWTDDLKERVNGAIRRMEDETSFHTLKRRKRWLVGGA